MRCAACSASWRAAPTAPLDLIREPDEDIFAAPVADEDELLARPASDLPADELPKVFRARAETERRVKEAAVQGAVWAGMGAVVALLLVAGVVFRVDVVRIWPKTASAYAQVGLAVNRVGLTIEQVHAQPSLQDGRQALVVSGVLRNIRAKPVTAPPLSIVLLDRAGRKLATKTASPGDALVPPGETRSFAVSLLDPPIAASDLEVTFVAGDAPASPRVRPVKVVPAEAPALRRESVETKAMLVGPVEEARPLPSSSPYALGPEPGQSR